MKVKKLLLSMVVAAAFAACATAPPKDEGFVVVPEDPNFPAGEIEAQIPKPFPASGLKKIIADVTYFPLDDAVCLRYRSDYYEYNQFWSKEGREVFIKALEQYGEDYSARSLKAKDKKTKNAYGGTEGFLTWQTVKLTKRFDAGMNMELGYIFSDNSPYFAVTQKLTTFKDPIDSENDSNSQEITMHFTRAQAQELAALFDQELLSGLSNMKRRPKATEMIVEKDVY